MSLLTRKGDLWVFDKPAGMLTHPARHDARDPLPDLMTWAREDCGAPEELAPCHRLDLETSGVLLASPDPKLRGEVGAGDARLAQCCGRAPKAHAAGCSWSNVSNICVTKLSDQKAIKKLAA